MPERIKAILEKMKEWWMKFSTKQKTLLLSITAAVIIALVILASVMSKPTWVPVASCEDATQAAKVKELLDGESIVFEVSDDGLDFKVKTSDEANASILLGSNDIPTKGYSIDDVFDGSFSATEADKNKKYQLHLEEKFAGAIETLSNVKSASVTLNIPPDDGTLAARNQESYASVMLELDGEMTEDQAASLARYVATELGNKTTNNITVMDSNSTMLFAGGESSSVAGTASSQLSYQNKVENKVKKEVSDVLSGTNVYDTVAIGLNLKLNFDQTTTNQTEFDIPEGRDEGYLTENSKYESEAVGGNAAIPGTDSNDENGPTYTIPDGETSNSSVSDISEKHALDQKDTQTIASVGDIKPDESSITVSLARYITYDEDILKADGTLDDISFDEYVAQNSERVKGTVDPDTFTMVSNATGIAEENISIVSYDIPMFKYSDKSGRTWQDYLQIALAVLIFALLGYVVFRSTRKEAEAELEPELSVESLLETTKEAQHEELEDIGYNEKSETKALIEKFVDENPEAVAALLRNWLNEEWN